MTDAPTNTTRRETVPEIEAILGQPFPVLDHGFIRVVDYMGSDSAIVQAARVSYGSGTKKTSQDRGLIRYLLRHRHTTPFEMCEIKLHIKLPIFVARQWIRHRTANVNEYSARYSILDKEFYIPSPETAATQSATNKQGRGHILPAETASAALEDIRHTSENAYETYLRLLNEPGDSEPATPGLARELARIVLPTNYYTQWYWKIDLHNLLHFVSLRADSHAQHEIRVYAEILSHILSQWVPLAWEAFQDYRQGGAHLSREELTLIKTLLAGQKLDKDTHAPGLSPREWAEFTAKLGLAED